MAHGAFRNRAIAEIAFGGLGAIGLGAALVPLRESVSACNLAFVFLAWTIVIAEMGGRAAALLTALLSALSLNFFLTRPYLSLQIHDPGDIIAFLALAGCGLIAALFGRRRQASEVAAGRAHGALATVRRAERALERDVPHAARLGAVADELRESLGLRAVALRGPRGVTAAVSPADFVSPPAPPLLLEPDSLIPEGDDGSDSTLLVRMGARGLRLPETGGRLSLRHAGKEVGTLDLWADDPSGLDTDQITALWVVARLVAVEMAAPAADPRPARVTP